MFRAEGFTETPKQSYLECEPKRHVPDILWGIKVGHLLPLSIFSRMYGRIQSHNLYEAGITCSHLFKQGVEIDLILHSGFRLSNNAMKKKR